MVHKVSHTSPQGILSGIGAETATQKIQPPITQIQVQHPSDRFALSEASANQNRKSVVATQDAALEQLTKIKTQRSQKAQSSDSITLETVSGPATGRPKKQPGVSPVPEQATPIYAPSGPNQIPAAPTELKMMSFNIYFARMKGLEAIQEKIAASKADVVCLQEVNFEQAKKLADGLGMYMAYHGSDRDGSEAPRSGNATLSRYPIENAQTSSIAPPQSVMDKALADNFEKSKKTAIDKAVKNAKASLTSLFKGHFQEAWEKGKAAVESVISKIGEQRELLEARGVLRTTLQVGERQLEILNTHLTLHSPDISAAQLKQLQTQAQFHQAASDGVFVLGDTNVNFAVQKAKGEGQATPQTDTLEEWNNRYHATQGNIADPDVQKIKNELTGALPSAWDVAQNKEVTDRTGQTWSPEKLEEEWSKKQNSTALRDLADGHTHLGAHKAFDVVLTDPRFVVQSAQVDHSGQNSDHSPILATVLLS